MRNHREGPIIQGNSLKAARAMLASNNSMMAVQPEKFLSGAKNHLKIPQKSNEKDHVNLTTIAQFLSQTVQPLRKRSLLEPLESSEMIHSAQHVFRQINQRLPEFTEIQRQYHLFKNPFAVLFATIDSVLFQVFSSITGSITPRISLLLALSAHIHHLTT